EANHAGTTRLADRDDPMLALASVIQAARTAAERHAAVATCGKVRVQPNGVNAIPSLVTAWLDARGPVEERVRAVVADVSSVVAAAGGQVAEESWTPPTEFAPDLVSRLSTLLDSAP